MASKRLNVLITGANGGLGYEAVKALMSRHEYDILVGCRDVQKGKDAIGKLQAEVPGSKSTLSVVQIDVSSDDSIQEAFEHVSSKYGKLDVLVNNAGISLDAAIQAGEMSLRQGWTAMWDTNVIGAHIMSHTFVPLLLKSSAPRLVFITSGTSSLSETQELEKMPLARLNASPAAGWPKQDEVLPILGYRSSKTGMNMLVTQWTRMLKNDGVKVLSVSPGFLATPLNGASVESLRKMGAEEPQVGGQFLRDVIVGDRDHQAGKSIRRQAEQPW